MAPKKQPARRTKTTPAATRGRPNPTRPEEPATQHEGDAKADNQNRGANGKLLLTAVPTRSAPSAQPGRRTPEADVENLTGRPDREAELFGTETNPAAAPVNPTGDTPQGNPSTGTQPDVGDLMRAFLNTKKAQELFRQYKLKRRTEGQQPRGKRPRRERSMEIVGERRPAPISMAAGFNGGLRRTSSPRRTNPPPPSHPIGGYDLYDLIQQNRGRGGFEAPRAEGIFDAFVRVQSPLSEEILNTPMPAWYKVPNNAPYNGIGNPKNFLGQFKYSMLNQSLGDVYMCKLFPKLLIDNARGRFDSLPNGSIRSYNEQLDVFSHSFSQRAEIKHTPAHLLTVKQSRPLQDFMTRFNRECQHTRGLNDLRVISAFQNDIQFDALYKEILAKDPQTITELWSIADKFSNIDEAARRRREGDRGETSNKKKEKSSPGRACWSASSEVL